MDPLIMIVIALFAGATLWVHTIFKKLDERLSNLEKQHLALVAELEQRFYQG
jgi:ATP-dependent protease HslVU (ClpYQ) peptidase subunit